MTQTSLNPDQAIAYLKYRFNVPYAKSYLAKCRCVGGGPVYFKIGPSVFYDQIDLDNWILAKKTCKTKSSSGMSMQDGLNIKIIETEPHYPEFDDGYIYMD